MTYTVRTKPNVSKTKIIFEITKGRFLAGFPETPVNGRTNKMQNNQKKNIKKNISDYDKKKTNFVDAHGCHDYEIIFFFK